PCTGEQQPPQQNFYAIPMEFQMDNWELYTLGKNIDMGLMKGYLDGDATVQYVNDRALDYLCCTRQEFREFFHNTIFGFIHPADVDMVRENLSALIKTNKPLRFSIRAIRQDGKIIILQGHSSCVIDNNGRPIGIHAFQDVTEDLERTAAMQCALEDKIAALNALVTVEQENQEALRLSEERYRLVVEQSGDILFEWNFATDHIHFADKHRQLFKRLAIEDNLTTNRIIRQLIHPDDQDLFENWIQETYKKSGFHKGEFRVATGENRYIWISSSSTAICDRNGNPLKAVGVFSDISNQKEEMDILVRKSQLDPLTQLYNKEEVQRQIENCIRHNPQQSAALFILDIDNFKGVNDNLGHQFGDTVLREVAQKTKSIFREVDILGRLGGDELVFFMQDVPNSDIIAAKAARLTTMLNITYFGETSKYTISASTGIAYYPQHGQSFHDLYRMADIALYESKRCGKNRHTIYCDRMSAQKM
ncbi:MAG: diguanylate cyclase, partial [Clostridiales bacterium]